MQDLFQSNRAWQRSVARSMVPLTKPRPQHLLQCRYRHHDVPLAVGLPCFVPHLVGQWSNRFAEAVFADGRRSLWRSQAGGHTLDFDDLRAGRNDPGTSRELWVHLGCLAKVFNISRSSSEIIQSALLRPSGTMSPSELLFQGNGHGSARV